MLPRCRLGGSVHLLLGRAGGGGRLGGLPAHVGGVRAGTVLFGRGAGDGRAGLVALGADSGLFAGQAGRETEGPAERVGGLRGRVDRGVLAGVLLDAGLLRVHHGPGLDLVCEAGEMVVDAAEALAGLLQAGRHLG